MILAALVGVGSVLGGSCTCSDRTIGGPEDGTLLEEFTELALDECKEQLREDLLGHEAALRDVGPVQEIRGSDQTNEVLCKALAYNLSVVTHAIYELTVRVL